MAAMAEICCGVVSESEASPSCEPSSRAARRRRMEIRRYKFIAGVTAPAAPDTDSFKRQKMEAPSPTASPRGCAKALEGSAGEEGKQVAEEEVKGSSATDPSTHILEKEDGKRLPKFGMMSVCGRRRDMEDAVSIHPFFCPEGRQLSSDVHFFGVFDGHGCSHVALCCKDRLHNIVAEELRTREGEWKEAMEASFSRMDDEVSSANVLLTANCRCELQTPQCDAVGTTAVVAVVTRSKVVVANCGDSRAVLCRKGKPVPLSVDHKPDRPDELQRIQSAGGRVIYWDGARVLGVLAMSRAIGDDYLKPYVTSVPEVTVTERSAEDECLILASDGLWDVVTNEVACDIARMCLRGQTPGSRAGGDGGSDKACSEAAMLLTKLALARQSSDNVSVVVVDLRRDT